MKWPLYGPKDSEIADLVLALADKGLRLAQIESGMKHYLQAWLEAVEADELTASSSDFTVKNGQKE